MLIDRYDCAFALDAIPTTTTEQSVAARRQTFMGQPSGRPGPDVEEGEV